MPKNSLDIDLPPQLPRSGGSGGGPARQARQPSQAGMTASPAGQSRGATWPSTRWWLRRAASHVPEA